MTFNDIRDRENLRLVTDAEAVEILRNQIEDRTGESVEHDAFVIASGEIFAFDGLALSPSKPIYPVILN